MIDRFDYTSPLGVLGQLADVMFLKRYMTRLLKERNKLIKSVAESGQADEFINGSKQCTTPAGETGC
ncbi:MAG: hypothetical protein KDA93_10815 [Planctomycetaceae bacterium]|nr:hypothetical protein [Planctomycetaceae bacterium]